MNDYFVRRASSANADVNPVWPIAEGKKGYAYYREKEKQKRLYGLGQLYTDDRLTLLGLIMSNYSVRCKPMTARSADGTKGLGASVLAASRCEAVVFGGVDLKEVFPPERFQITPDLLEPEELRRIGEAAQAEIDAFLKAHPNYQFRPSAQEAMEEILSGR